MCGQGGQLPVREECFVAISAKINQNAISLSGSALSLLLFIP